MSRRLYLLCCCPSCGHDVAIRVHGAWHRVECAHCGCTTVASLSPHLARQRWNGIVRGWLRLPLFFVADNLKRADFGPPYMREAA